jgi:hypothetical protein
MAVVASRRTAKPASSEEEIQASGTVIWQAPLGSFSTFHPVGWDAGAVFGRKKANRAKTLKYLIRRL